MSSTPCVHPLSRYVMPQAAVVGLIMATLMFVVVTQFALYVPAIPSVAVGNHEDGNGVGMDLDQIELKHKLCSVNEDVLEVTRCLNKEDAVGEGGKAVEPFCSLEACSIVGRSIDSGQFLIAFVYLLLWMSVFAPWFSVVVAARLRWPVEVCGGEVCGDAGCTVEEKREILKEYRRIRDFVRGAMEWSINAPPVLGVIGTIASFGYVTLSAGDSMDIMESFKGGFFNAAFTTLIGGVFYVFNLVVNSAVEHMMHR